MGSESPDSIRGISDYLREEFDLDKEDVEEMLDEFIKNINSLVQTGKEQIEKSSWEDLKRTGHSVKGAAANIGANFISKAGKQLEEHALSANKSECELFVEQIAKGLDCLR